MLQLTITKLQNTLNTVRRADRFGSFPAKQDLVKVWGIDLAPDILTCHKRRLSALATGAQSEPVISHNIDSPPDPERNANTRRLFFLSNLTIYGEVFLRGDKKYVVHGFMGNHY
ncbi:hypothetical protein CDAR_453801 [Caerostris darwini]|uniref:Uncharacterized protein n=1 Tax=Caerostris darwini TaxID=1538125 RepID=A0AAV4UD02_9ARAC|nr:hypothetical protein CDAR_453801 [Caerostris darwini]